MFEEQGPDDMKSEFPSCLEECFYSSLEGSYFKAELSKARDEKRIGLPLPYDPTRPVHTLGMTRADYIREQRKLEKLAAEQAAAAAQSSTPIDVVHEDEDHEPSAFRKKEPA